MQWHDRQCHSDTIRYFGQVDITFAITTTKQSNKKKTIIVASVVNLHNKCANVFDDDEDQLPPP